MNTVFPTHTTIYKPDRFYNGYTLFPSMKPGVGALLIDMNGNMVKQWAHIDGFMVNLLPEGRILGGRTGRVTSVYDHYHGADDVVQEDWDGNVEWCFGRADELDVDAGKGWSARQNHDIVREGCPVGYFVPDTPPAISNGKLYIRDLVNAVCIDISAP